MANNFNAPLPKVEFGVRQRGDVASENVRCKYTVCYLQAGAERQNITAAAADAGEENGKAVSELVS